MPLLVVLSSIASITAVGLAGRLALRSRKAVSPRDDQPQAVAKAKVAHQSRLFEKRQNVLRILSQDTQALFEGRMTVGQLMSPRVQTAPSSMSVEDLKQLCREKQIRHVLITDAAGRVVGVVSDRDLSVRDGQTAADIMTADPVTAASDMLVGPAMTTMLDKRVHCLPVIDDGKPCGMLTSSDLLIALQCALQLLAKASVCGTQP